MAPVTPTRPGIRSASRRSLLPALSVALVLLAGTFVADPLPAGAQAVAGAASEERVKAAYLFRILNYVEFPARANAAGPYVVGVVEDEIVAGELAQLVAGKQAAGRDIVVRKLAAGAPLGGLDVLFISRSERARQPYLLKQVRSAPVLTVTETAEGLEQGSIVNFRIADGHVRFEISLPAADQAGIKLSSRLLALALKVVKEP
jgi:hypothetical protein